MALKIDIYFDPGDIQTLVSGSPNSVLITCELVKVAGSSDPILVAFAALVNSQGIPERAVLGCPTPCKPGDPTNGINCLGESAALLQQLKSQITNPLNFLNSL